MTYAEILAEYEVYPTDSYYVLKEGLFVERHDERFRLVNLMAVKYCWRVRKYEYTRGWCRSAKRRINARLERFFSNMEKKLKKYIDASIDV